LAITPQSTQKWNVSNNKKPGEEERRSTDSEIQVEMRFFARASSALIFEQFFIAFLLGRFSPGSPFDASRKLLSYK
jgi:hypothetical protein